MLLDVGGAHSITSAALDRGINHFGLFARQYRAAFGELPSAVNWNRSGTPAVTSSTLLRGLEIWRAGGVPIDANRDPTPNKILQVLTETYAGFVGGPISVLIHTQGPSGRVGRSLCLIRQAAHRPSLGGAGWLGARRAGHLRAIGRGEAGIPAAHRPVIAKTALGRGAAPAAAAIDRALRRAAMRAEVAPCRFHCRRCRPGGLDTLGQRRPCQHDHGCEQSPAMPTCPGHCGVTVDE